MPVVSIHHDQVWFVVPIQVGGDNRNGGATCLVYARAEAAIAIAEKNTDAVAIEIGSG